MNGIERLEEIKSRVWKDKGTYAMGDYSQREGYIYTLSDYDYEWLIEQAERVEEYRSNLEHGAMVAVKTAEKLYHQQQENKRYREAIEVAIHNMAASDNLGVKFALGVLEQALEGRE